MKRKRAAETTATSAKRRRRRAPSGGAVMQPAVTDALRRSLFTEWARDGYGALSLESVARRAGVGKAALYRRWDSKLNMVTDCLKSIDADPVAWAEAPDAGSLEADVRQLLGAIKHRVADEVVRHILPDLHAEMLRSPELASAIRERLEAAYRKPTTAILQRAMARRELSANIDMDLARDALCGMIYWRMIVVDGPADRKYLDRLASFIAAGLRSP